MLVPQLLLFLYCFAFCLNSAISAPIHSKRQDGTNKAMSVTTVDFINTPKGRMKQTCTITFTPVTSSVGIPEMQEVKACNLQPEVLNGASSATVPSTTGSSVSPAQSLASTLLSPPASAVPSSSSVASAPSPPVTSSSSPLQPTSATVKSPGLSSGANSAEPSPTGTIIVHGVSSIPISALPNPTVNAIPTSPVVPGVLPSGSVKPTTSTASAEAANQASQTPTQKFQIPGKNLSVLPIGLGVFAGILVIGLIVVGLVTYERTKYRKAFRQRRLAEMGANTGYGGMGQV